MEKRLTTVLAADICNYSALAEENEDFAISVVGIVFGLFQEAITKHHGRVFNKAGDGFFAEFPTATSGVLAAQDFLKQLEDKNIETPDSVKSGKTKIKARVGLHVGDVKEQTNGDLLGHGVNVASRLQSEAQSNGIVASQHCMHLVRETSEIAFRKLGSLNLKNIQEPISAYYVERNRTRMNAFKQLASVYQKKLFTPLTAFLLAGFILAGSFFVFEIFTAREQRAIQLAEAEAEIAALKSNIDALTLKISQTQPDATQDQILLLRDVAESLANSQSPEKVNVRSLIEAGRIDDAQSLLYILFNKQQKENVESETIATTAKELGALSFYSHKNTAIEAYEWLWDNSGFTDYSSLIRLGDLYINASKIAKARDAYQIVADNTSDKKMSVQAQIGLGRYFLRKEAGSNDEEGENNESTAEEYFLNAMAESTANNFPIEKVRAVGYLRAVANIRGDVDKAEGYAREAISIERSMPARLQSDNRRSANYFSLGAILREQQKPEEALKYFEQSFEIAQKINDKQNMVFTLYNKATVYYDIENFLESKQTLLQALEIAGDEVMDNSRTHIYYALALIADKENNQVEICEMLTKWREYFVRSSNSANDDAEDLYRQHCI